MSLPGRTGQKQPKQSPVDAVERLNEIGRTLLQEDPESAQKRFQHALQLAEKINHVPGAAQAHSGLAIVYQSLGMDKKATEHAQSAEDLCFVLEKPQHVGQIFQNLGDMYRNRSENEAAHASYQQALTRFKMGNDRRGMLEAYSAVGALHAATGAYDAALDAYMQAAQLAKAAQADPQLASIYIDIAKIYYEQELVSLSAEYAQKAVGVARLLESNRKLIGQMHNLLGVLAKSQGDTTRAQAHYAEALKLRQLIHDDKGAADTHHNIGILYEEENRLEYALHYYSQALAIRREIDDQPGLAKSFTVLGTSHRRLQQYDMANNYLQRALQIAEKLKLLKLQSNIQFELAELYAEVGDFEQAFRYQQTHTNLRRHLFSVTRSAQIAQAQTKFEAFQELQQEEVARLQSAEIEQRVEERIQPIIESLETFQQEADLTKQSLAQVEEISTLKTQLMRAVSHELRTPLAVIANASYMLERFDRQLEASKREANFARIKESIVYMKELLDETSWVDASVLAKIRVKQEFIDLSALCERVCEGLSVSALERQRLLVTTPDIEDSVRVDVALVQQIVNQLVSNAMKFSRAPSGESPLVELDMNFLAQELIVSVSDGGIGIPVEDQAKIGIPFARASNASEIRGLGLGLSIVANIVEAMHGRLVVESGGVGQGCQMTVVLPCDTGKSAEPFHLQTNPRVIA